MEIKPELLDELLKDYKDPSDVLGKNGLLKQFKKAVLERILNAELTEHLGYEKHDAAGHGSGNSRNGTSEKTLQGEDGKLTIEVPRDRNGAFEPKVVPKHQRRFEGFDDAILSLYARGLTTREIEGHLREIYGVDVSAGLISQVTEAVMDEVRSWQNRPLENIYAIIFLDAMFVKMRHEGRVENRAVYVAMGITMEGKKEVLGLWMSGTEGAKFWLGVLSNVKSRGMADVLIVCVDGLKGFPEAIESVYPQAKVQLCVVHLIRRCLNYVSWKDRKKVAADLKPIYRAASADQAEMELSAFEEKWRGRYEAIGKQWREQWTYVTPLFEFSPEIRKVMYTTNAVESLHRSMRKVIKTRGSFPNEESATKLLYLAVRNQSAKWEGVQHWKEALNQFEILWGERIRAAQQLTPTRT